MRHESAEAFGGALTSVFQKGTGPKVGNLFWANDVLFRYFAFSPSDSINKEYLRGHLPLDFLEFAIMPRFKKEIRVGDFIITVLDVSNHHTHNILTRWISENLVTKNSSKIPK